VTYTTHSEEETIALGNKLAQALPRRATVLLVGNLGAGKTALAKGILEGLGVARTEEVTSPTFTLIHEYGGESGEGRAYHIDLYRLDTSREVEALGIEDLLEREAVVLIEWGERFPRLWKGDPIKVQIRVAEDPDSRIIEVVNLESNS
jgi:tRNA threonylcarbamoyladenosine biosynthesis protein TsaE